ncbi:uncharacterized protein [Ptychodera flava]|uniref:uncharacterized protein n=1 Tax=Ptychodera flava TaxID=63121 RepID=UPI00396A95E3
METWVKGVIIAVAVTVVLIVLFVPLGYGYINYYEFGFTRQRSTGKVYTHELYTEGRHYIGIDYAFIKYPSFAQNVLIKNLTVFTQDSEELKLYISFQYFIREDEAALLHRKYSKGYTPTLYARARDAILKAATEIHSSEFWLERDVAESKLKDALQIELGGECCEKDCILLSEGCRTDCRRYDFCSEERKGMFMYVKYMQLLRVDLSPTLTTENLSNAKSEVRAKGAVYDQEVAVVEKEIEREVQIILNQAEEIRENGSSHASLIRQQAEAEARATIDVAHRQGISRVFSYLGIRTVEHKASFMYLRTLKYKQDLYLSVDFNQLTMSSNIAVVPNDVDKNVENI